MKTTIKVFAIGLLAVTLFSCSGNTNQQQVPAAPTVPAEQVAPVDTSVQAQPQAQASATAVQAVPDVITAFVQQYFPGATVARVETDNEHGGIEYELTLNDGTEVDFDANNQWEKIDTHTKAVPAALVPQAVADYVKAQYQSLFIVKIDKDYNGYDIELSNGMDLDFDQAGRFVRVDD